MGRGFSFVLWLGQRNVCRQAAVRFRVAGFPTLLSSQRPYFAALPTGKFASSIDQKAQTALQVGFVEFQSAELDRLAMVLPEFNQPAVGEVFLPFVLPKPLFQHPFDVLLVKPNPGPAPILPAPLGGFLEQKLAGIQEGRLIEPKQPISIDGERQPAQFRRQLSKARLFVTRRVVIF